MLSTPLACSATSASADEAGEAEEGERAGGRDVDGESALDAGSAETLVPGDLEGRIGEIEVAVVGAVFVVAI